MRRALKGCTWSTATSLEELQVGQCPTELHILVPWSS